MTLIIVLHVVVCVFLVGVILLQPGKSDSGIGFGSTSQSIFGSRGAGNILTHTTAVAAALFLILSFVLARERMAETSSSVIRPEAASESTPPAATPPTAPAAATPEAAPAKPATPAAPAAKPK